MNKHATADRCNARDGPIAKGADGKSSPLADEMLAVDREHDGWGAATYKLAESLLAIPNVSNELRAAGELVFKHFVPSLDALRAKYVDEVEAANENRPRLKEHRAVLEAVRTPDGSNLYKWIHAQLDAAAALHKLIEARSDVPKGLRKDVARLRVKGLSILTNFRTAFTDEFEMDPNLARDLEQKIFGYMDYVATSRASGTSTEDEDNGDPTPTPPAPPAPPAT